MKKILSVALALLLGLTLMACGKKKPQLAAPENVAIAGGTITWDAVENAEAYVVTITKNEQSEEHEVTETRYRVQDLTGAFTFGVYAKAEGYRDSAVSEGSFTPAPAEVTGVSISGPSSVKSGGEITLRALVSGTGTLGDDGVVWSVTSGKAATVSADGKVTASTVSRNENVTIRAASKLNGAVYAEKTITVLARVTLTEAMLGEVKVDTVEFSGQMTIDAYTIGPFPKLESSYELTLKTIMDGTHWYAEYMDSYSETPREMYCAKGRGDDRAYQVVLGYDNQEEYIPMIAPNGTTENWDEYGMYNGFTRVELSDFAFDEDTFTYKYVGGDSGFAARMAAAANPYDFDAKADGFSLIVSPGRIVGFRILGEDDYSVVPGRRSETALQVNVNAAASVEVPTIATHDREPYHERLEKAIETMRGLTSYKTTVFHTFASAYGSGHNGYEETVTDEVCLFRDFSYDGYDNRDAPINLRYDSEPYGYKKIDENKYDQFYRIPSSAEEHGGEYVAQRAYTAAFSEAKPGFGFAAEIFTKLPNAETAGSPTNECDYMMLDLNLATVTTEFYASASADMQILGIYATSALFTGNTVMYPYVTVETIEEKEYITGSGFFYNMGIMYGVVEIVYSDFDKATVSETIDFTPREIPTSWEQLTFEDLEDNPTSAKEVIASAFKSDLAAAESVPFISVLGDTFGFAILDVYQPYGESRMRPAAALYYDVPLDRNYSIATSINAVATWLQTQGFVGNDRYEFKNEATGVGIALVDRDLDFYIYVYSLK